MGNRKGKKGRLNLFARRKVCTNLREYNRCKINDLPHISNISGADTIQNYKVINNTTFNCLSNDVIDTNPESLLDEMETQGHTSNSQDNLNIEGRRIIQLDHFFTSLKLISDHGHKFGCTFSNLNIIEEIQQGLNSMLKFKCTMCNSTFSVSTNETKNYEIDTINVNTAAVEGIMSIGAGFYNLEEFLCSLEIPCMNKNTYNNYHNIVSDAWEKVAFEKMQEAAKKEAEYAIKTGNVDKNGTPCITVVADACWAKRSYKSNYNALSGAAAIVGHQFGEILYIGIRNKYCSICNHAKQNNIDAKSHICFKNYEGSSTGMESNILVEGFKSSIDMFGIKYTKMIADGDSSTYKKILDLNPYKDTPVEKIECRNHILRNFCNKLKTISSDTRFPIHLRKLLSARILRLRRAVVSAVKYRKSNDTVVVDKIKNLKEDIENSLNHVFGDHTKCAEYFCKKKAEENLTADLKNYPEMYNRLLSIIKLVSRHARSLLFDVDSNVVEQFHSIVAKFVGGKRINFAKGRSYQSRCYAAVVSFNSKNRAHYYFHKSVLGKSPCKIKSNFEIKRSEKVKKTLKYKKPARKETFNEDENYGVYCQKPDMELEEFEMEKKIFLERLMTTAEQRTEFEQNTILQSESATWLEERRKLLTASNFFSVCRRLPTTSCVMLVKQLLYGKDISHVTSIKHGKSFEPISFDILQKQIEEPIMKCGMFVDKEFPFLAATPDGLVGNDTVVEIKCPYNPQNLSLNELIDKKKVTFWKKEKGSDELCINKHHSWYYQIQGQLRTTGRNKCILAVCSNYKELKIEIITRDDVFWSENMEKKLIKFYMDCMLPELIDSRYKRNMKIRDPEYIELAIKNKKK